MFEKEVGDIKVENGKIAEIGFFNEGGVDMSGCLVLPGFVDIHIHGGEGADFSDGDTASFDAMSRYLAKHGVTSFCGTTMTLSQDKLRRIVSAAADYTAPKSKLVGINLEGPYIAMSKKGAQNAEYVRAGSVDEVRELYSICDKIKLITIAPEAFDSAEFIKEVSRFMSVSVGHSAANAEQCRTAFDNDNVMCEIICDGEHICPTVLRNSFDILGEDRACVISDSMRGAGVGEGEFELGGQTTYVKPGYKVAKLADGTIAASITNVFDEFKNLLSFGIDFKTALKSCTINPARSIGEQDNIGSIAVGKCADFIVTDENFNIKEVYINGTLA